MIDPIIIWSAALKLIFALVAVKVWWWTVRLINRSAGVAVRSAIATIEQNAVALAIYRVGILFCAAYLIAHAIGG